MDRITGLAEVEIRPGRIKFEFNQGWIELKLS